MAFSDYKRDLKADVFDADGILHRYYHAGQSAIFNGADPSSEPSFKRAISDQVSQALGVKCHPLQLVICGSAHLGFSPVPEKLGKPFDFQKSDVDIAVVSAEIFDRWWTEMQELKAIPDSTRIKIAADLFWGFIDPFKVHHLSATGSTWWKLFGSFQTDRGRAVRGRVYRTYWNMQNYHKRAIIDGREKLISMRVS